MKQSRQSSIWNFSNPGNRFQNKQYLPQSALRNRHVKQFQTEMPQGQQYFQPSRKKQYASVHNRSQIKQIQLFDQGQRLPTIHNNLYIHDIEGAAPNTLLSQSIKNKMKSKLLSKYYLPSNQKMVTLGTEDYEKEYYPKRGYYPEKINNPQQNYRLQKNSIEPIQLRQENKVNSIGNYHFAQSVSKSTQNVQLNEKKKKLKYESDTVKEQVLGHLLKNNHTPEQIKNIESSLVVQQNEKQQIIYKKRQPIKKPNSIFKANYTPTAQIRKWNPTFLPQNIIFSRNNSQIHPPY